MEIKSKNISIVSISKLKMKANNRNKHGQDQIEELAKQFKYQGFRNPLIVSNQSGEIVCGNGRFLAAKRAGLKELPVIYQDYDSPEQEYKHHVADNGISLWAELDIPSIKIDLIDLGFDSGNLGIRNFKLDEDESTNENKEIDLNFKYKLEIDAETEEKQQELFEEMENRGFKVRLLI